MLQEDLFIELIRTMKNITAAVCLLVSIHVNAGMMRLLDFPFSNRLMRGVQLLLFLNSLTQHLNSIHHGWKASRKFLRYATLDCACWI